MVDLTGISTTLFLSLIFGLGILLARVIWNSQPQQPATKTPKPRLFWTVRISNIPRSDTNERLRRVLIRNDAESTPDSSKNLAALSYAPSPVASLALRFSVSTGTFRYAPNLEELRVLLQKEFGRDAARLRIDDDFLGLTTLYDPENGVDVDIIAVTGLAGRAFGSWKTKSQADMWLRDFLPHSVPTARIMTYGYDTRLPGSYSEAAITDLSRKLLESIKTTRDETSKNRPLILIGHSLGGLVVKQAWVYAHEGSKEDNAIAMSCCGLLFFGVPNRGLNIGSLETMVKGQPNGNLIRDLAPKSRFLADLTQRFDSCFTLKDTKVISIYETRETATVQWSDETASWRRTGPRVMMVEHMSAIHATSREKYYDQLPIDADHSDLVKFPDQADHNYAFVEKRIIELVSEGPNIVRERFANERKQRTELEKNFIKSLDAPEHEAFRNDVRDETPGTLGWFLEKEEFKLWKTSSESTILWITGPAAQGKTILAKFLLKHLEDPAVRKMGTVVIYFFFDEQGTIPHNINSALRFLIRQLLVNSHKPTFPSILYDVEALNLELLSEETLWKLFESLLQASMLGNITCVIDALDECKDQKSIRRLVGLFERLTKAIHRDQSKPPTLKTIFLSRPTVDMDIHRVLSRHLRIDLMAKSDDIKAFVLQEVEIIGIDDNIKDETIKLLQDQIGQTFLWVSLVIKRLRAEGPLSMLDVKSMIQNSPTELDDFYDNIVTEILRRESQVPKKILLWATYGQRSLTLAELEEAILVQDNPESTKEAMKTRVKLTKERLSPVVGVIIDVRGNRVRFIHQSVKDFLLKSHHLAGAEFCGGLAPNLYLAKICIQYICFSELVTNPNGREDQENLLGGHNGQSFLGYASRHWPHHIGDDPMSIATLSELIIRITAPHSRVLLMWGKAAGIFGIETAKELWNIAVLADIPWLTTLPSVRPLSNRFMIAEAAKGGISEYNNLLARVRSPSGYISGDDACSITSRFDERMVRAMLSTSGSRIITRRLIIAAATNTRSGLAILGLLGESAHGFSVTEKMIYDLFGLKSLHQPNLVGQNTGVHLNNVIEVLIRGDKVKFMNEAYAILVSIGLATFDIIFHHPDYRNSFLSSIRDSLLEDDHSETMDISCFDLHTESWSETMRSLLWMRLCHTEFTNEIAVWLRIGFGQPVIDAFLKRTNIPQLLEYDFKAARALDCGTGLGTITSQLATVQYLRYQIQRSRKTWNNKIKTEQVKSRMLERESQYDRSIFDISLAGIKPVCWDLMDRLLERRRREIRTIYDSEDE
ncbi:uncharacterized protein F4822DRAFT_396967 [Hypoxylon trugodes]|uniref:uncharacterized protein n=1 Tax=Hypoxylon trugodes TaxID=326681 RepID=UPI00219BDFE3|nr:uncharacterized protein F4822DRAFT_396967 [Hypoxylon trugodes]KAI1391513.1 hypothetical protein F4822DRAFT_396967 [Hypoxylon trugodes]